jgi:hypothetical protein
MSRVPSQADSMTTNFEWRAYCSSSNTEPKFNTDLAWVVGRTRHGFEVAVRTDAISTLLSEGFDLQEESDDAFNPLRDDIREHGPCAAQIRAATSYMERARVGNRYHGTSLAIYYRRRRNNEYHQEIEGAMMLADLVILSSSDNRVHIG